MIIYAIKDLKGNFYNRVHKEFRPLGQNTAFYKTHQLAHSEMSFSLRRHHTTQYDKRKDKAKGIEYYKELDRYIDQHFAISDVCVVKIEIKEIVNDMENN